MLYLSKRNLIRALLAVGGIGFVAGIASGLIFARVISDDSPLEVARAATAGENTRINSPARLEELTALDGLFGAGAGEVSGNRKVSRLGELIVLENLFGAGVAGNRRPASVALERLIVVDGLFGRRPGDEDTSSRDRISSLGELIVLDGLFGTDTR